MMMYEAEDLRLFGDALLFPSLPLGSEEKLGHSDGSLTSVAELGLTSPSALSPTTLSSADDLFGYGQTTPGQSSSLSPTWMDEKLDLAAVTADPAVASQLSSPRGYKDLSTIDEVTVTSATLRMLEDMATSSSAAPALTDDESLALHDSTSALLDLLAQSLSNHNNDDDDNNTAQLETTILSPISSQIVDELLSSAPTSPFSDYNNHNNNNNSANQAGIHLFDIPDVLLEMTDDAESPGYSEIDLGDCQGLEELLGAVKSENLHEDDDTGFGSMSEYDSDPEYCPHVIVERRHRAKPYARGGTAGRLSAGRCTNAGRSTNTAPTHRTIHDKKQRKKQQNKDAATRYREKKRQEAHEEAGALQSLEERNKSLKDNVTQMTQEINYLKNLLVEIYPQTKFILTSK